MTRCPKCGSANVTGPKYERRWFDSSAVAQDWLVYQCVRCGYMEREAPKDRRGEEPDGD